jgi:hypothetical protein
LFGFLIAPGVPALAIYVINLYLVPQHDAELGGVMSVCWAMLRRASLAFRHIWWLDGGHRWAC